MADLIRKGTDLEELVRNGELTFEGSADISFFYFFRKNRDTKSMAEKEALMLANRRGSHYVLVGKLRRSWGKDIYPAEFYSQQTSF